MQNTGGTKLALKLTPVSTAERSPDHAAGATAPAAATAAAAAEQGTVGADGGAAVGLDALSSILNQVFSGVFGGGMSAEEANETRRQRRRAHLRSLQAHDGNSLTVLQTYLTRAGTWANLARPRGLLPVLSPAQAAQSRLPMVHLSEVTRAALDVIDEYMLSRDMSFEDVFDSNVDEGQRSAGAAKMRELMEKGREDAKKTEEQLAAALARLDSPGDAGAARDGAAPSAEAAGAAANRDSAAPTSEQPNSPPSATADGLAGDTQRRRVRVPYEFMPLSLLAYNFLLQESVDVQRQYQGALQKASEDLERAFTSDVCGEEAGMFTNSQVRPVVRSSVPTCLPQSQVARGVRRVTHKQEADEGSLKCSTGVLCTGGTGGRRHRCSTKCGLAHGAGAHGRHLPGSRHVGQPQLHRQPLPNRDVTRLCRNSQGAR